MVARGYRVIIITSKHSNDLSHESIEEGIKIYRLPIYNFGKKRYPFPRKNKTYKELLKKIKAENIDYFVINTRFQLPSLIGAKIAKEQGKQAIFTDHGTTYLTINSNSIKYYILSKNFSLLKLKRILKYSMASLKKQPTDYQSLT